METDSERWFAVYLETHGYVSTYEPDLNGIKNPDFLMEKSGLKAICEVKEFQTEGIFTNFDYKSDEVLSRPIAKTLKPIRNQISSASKQLKEYRNLGYPLIVILANPGNAQVKLSDAMVISAMFGDLSTVFRTDENGNTNSFDLANRNGILTNNHKYLSGVVVLEQVSKNQESLEEFINNLIIQNAELSASELMNHLRDFELTLDQDDLTFKCTVFENDISECIPISNNLFNGVNDRRYRPSNGVISLHKQFG